MEVEAGTAVCAPKRVLVLEGVGSGELNELG